MSEPLRVCRVCGLEAWTEDDLEGFVKHSASSYGRENWCKECRRVFNRRRRRESVFFRDRRVYIGVNPRLNVCSICGRSYPEELSRQTDLHHQYYNPSNPLGGVVELCISCHRMVHNLSRHPLSFTQELMVYHE